jgi:uncharacterized protein (DUF924 family)
MTPDNVVSFWKQAGPASWFTKDTAFDGQLSVRFRAALAEARAGAFDHWAEMPQGALALVILLDQFSRNIHRNTPLAFAADAKAAALSTKSVARGYLHEFPAPMAQWFVMPFEHAEDIDAQWRAVGLFQSMGLPEMVRYAYVHLDIIRRFGRFPHRNPILGRRSTAEEIAFLKGGGFGG